LAKDPKDNKKPGDFKGQKFDNKPQSKQPEPKFQPKNTPPPKGTPPTPQKAQVPQMKTSPVPKQSVQTIPGESNQRTIIRGPESLVDIRSNISKLCDEEMRLLAETEGLSEAINSQASQDYLARTHFQVNESPQGIVTLTRTVDNHVVVISFDKFEEPRAEEEGRNEEEEEEDVDEEQEDEDEEEIDGRENEGQESDLPYKTNIGVDVKFTNPDGSFKGRWLLHGFAGKDNRLYISDMAIVKDENPTVPSKEDEDTPPQHPMIPFDSLSDDMQDRLYDFLDEVGVDDRLANFVKNFLIQAEVKQANKFLEELKALMKP